jgi:chromosome segregation ATPase
MRQLAFVILLAAANAVCQTPAKDPDTLPALLLEVRQLRQALEAMTVASQRVQIALSGLQVQAAAVARDGQRLDEARNKRMQAEENRDHFAAEVQMTEARSAVRTGIETDTELKIRELGLTQLKSQLETTTAEVQSRQAAESEAATQFRTSQAKLGELQDRIEGLDRVLAKMGAPGK